MYSNKMILGIETSCDETAASIVQNGHNVLSNIIYSQAAKHSKFGGVLPEYASRLHLEVINEVVKMSISQAGLTINDIDAIAVTNRPGLTPSLLIGSNFALGLSIYKNIPMYCINHLTAHVYSVFLNYENHNRLINDRSNVFPILALIISGGHTILLQINENNIIDIIGTTIDDAAGEALDKGARIMQLCYPGGPMLENIAKIGNKNIYYFPRGMTKNVEIENRFNFSFSGLKTSLLYHVRNLGDIYNMDILQIADTIASYQFAVIDVLCIKLINAIKFLKPKTVVVCGGVAQNHLLQKELFNRIFKIDDKCSLLIAKKEYCGDNAAMIAGLCWYDIFFNNITKTTLDNFFIEPNCYPKLF